LGQTEKGDVMVRIVTETRPKEYINKGYVDPETGFKGPLSTSRGFETKKEIALCPPCAKIANVDEFGRELIPA